MNTSTPWHDFLSAQGASWPENGAPVFEAAASTSPALSMSPLTQTTCLRYSGPDTSKFLQGQLTCDVSRVSPDAATLGAACTPKGRMVANFRIAMPQSGQFLLTLPQLQDQTLQQALAKYIPFYKSEHASLASEWAGIGLWGNEAPKAISELLSPAPDSVHRSTQLGNGLLIRVHGNPARFEAWLPVAEAIDAWNRLAGRFQAQSANQWQLEDIRAGIGWVTPELTEAFVPQMLNLQHLDAISFSKGCYTGQEIVARMQYRGTLKKHLFRLDTDAEADFCSPGTPIFRADEDSSAGELVQSASSGDRVELLAVTKVEAAHEGRLRLGSPDGPHLSLLQLPYSTISD